MPTALRILIVEDEPDDAELMVAALRRAGIEPEWQRVDTEQAYLQGLRAGPDVILTDYRLPYFSALRALELRRERSVHIPMIVVSGTIGDEAAVECLQLGAMDYVLKDRLARLGPAVERALRERATEQAKRAAEAGLRRLAEELERRVSDRTARLEAVNRELEAFAYSAAHDLRSPLAAIGGFTEVLAARRASLDEADRRCLDGILAATEAMARLIDGFLALAQAARQPLLRERVDLSSAASEVADALRANDPAGGASFVIAEGLEASGDPRLLRSVLANLLGNAWKYTRDQPSPRIEFGCVEREGEATYFVRDNGAGFDPAEAARVFEPFQRLAGTEQQEGSGIGLATVMRIVARHGGRVWAESTPGEGASFSFTLGSGEDA